MSCIRVECCIVSRVDFSLVWGISCSIGNSVCTLIICTPSNAVFASIVTWVARQACSYNRKIFHIAGARTNWASLSSWLNRTFRTVVYAPIVAFITTSIARRTSKWQQRFISLRLTCTCIISLLICSRDTSYTIRRCVSITYQTSISAIFTSISWGIFVFFRMTDRISSYSF